jgi:hypothetical protein
MGLTVVCLALNGYAMVRAVKIRHFLGLFSEWPGLPEEGSPVNETRLLAASARQAFFYADYDKACALIDRLGPASPQASLAKGRALTLAGRFDEALPSLELGGQGLSARRYLIPRRSFGLFLRRYFQGSEVRWALKPQYLLGLALLALALCMPVLAADFQAFSTVIARRTADFSDKDFKLSTQGAFTLHYHDEAFMHQCADVGEEALAQALELLGLPAGTFAPGQIHLFLCADQAEYLARSPHTRSWEAASALPEKHQIFLYYQPREHVIIFERVLAHELTHLCYHRLVPHSREDSWLNEGLADYVGCKFALERAHYPRDPWLKENIFEHLKKHALPFEAFLAEDPRIMHDESRIEDFYTQGFSIVYMLIEYYGREPFLRFLRVFGAGKSLPEALSAAYPAIKDSADLEADWERFMR